MRTALTIFAVLLVAASAFGVDYPIVAVKAPRYGDDKHAHWQDVFHPTNGEPGSDLVLIYPDGTEEVLVDAGDKGCVMDPCPSLDGRSVYYVLVEDIAVYGKNNLHVHGGMLAKGGADIYRIDLGTRKVTRLTNQEWSPNTTHFKWSKSVLKSDPPGTVYRNYGVYNTGPCPLPDGRILFTSDRNNFLPTKHYTFPNLQLFVMDADGKNVECVGHLNLGSALHPVLMRDGRVMWSSLESQGHRDSRLWGLWASYPDGRNWEPLMSAFVGGTALHFAAERTDGMVAVTAYYLANNSGFGTLWGFPSSLPDSLATLTRFGPPNPAENVAVPMRYTGTDWPFKFGFSPQGIVPLTPSSNHLDEAADIDPDDRNKRLGKYTHPSAAPNSDLLAVYSPGPVNHLTRPIALPRPHGQLVRLPGGKVAKPSEHVVVKSDVNFNYQQPKAVLSWKAIYGQDPVSIPWLPSDGKVHAKLPEGTPFGLIGTSSFYKRDSANVSIDGGPAGWVTQGSDSGKYDNSEIHAVRIVQTEPTTNLVYPYRDGQVIDASQQWSNPIKERLRILGEIPLRKADGVLDPDGNPDTSFLAKIPADTPFTFQTIDKEGRVLNMAQTWHQVRPGEMRVNCGGCHAHSQHGTDFSRTAAAKPDYEIAELLAPARDREFDRDVWPIVQAKCAECHTETHPNLDMSTPEKAYTNLLAGRVVAMRPRESLLSHKIAGKKLDGSTGNVAGGQMPLGKEPLSAAEIRVIDEWIGLGAARGTGVFTDDLRPTLTITHPRSDEAAQKIMVGAFDTHSGLKDGSFRALLNGQDISSQFLVDHFVWTANLTEPVPSGELRVEISDKAGNVHSLTRTFRGSVAPPPVAPPPDELAELKETVKALRMEVQQLKAIIDAVRRALP